jgi:protein-L-isoaspartate(D-aspartate) O-methyltransferase
VRLGPWPGLVVFACLIIAPGEPTAAPPQEPTVADQMKARGVDDPRVLEALRRVPREAFVPPALRDRAHVDQPLPIGHGQTISQPYVVALMTQLLDPPRGGKVLEIGTGSGYQAAILAELAREVYSVEIVPELATTARLRLTRQGYRNVHVKLGDGGLGWREYAPFDRIIVTAAALRVPQPLIDQLVDGGVLVMPLGPPGGRQVLVRGVKRDGKLHAKEIAPVRFVPLQQPRRDPPRRGPEAGEGAADPAKRGQVPAPADRPVAPPENGSSRPHDDTQQLIEEDLPPGPESGRRSLQDVRIRVARAPSARDSGRRCAGGTSGGAGARSRAGGR